MKTFELFFVVSVLWIAMVPAHVVDGVHAREDVAELVRSANLDLYILIPVQVPPIPGLHHRITELGKGHPTLVQTLCHPVASIVSNGKR